MDSHICEFSVLAYGQRGSASRN